MPVKIGVRERQGPVIVGLFERGPGGDVRVFPLQGDDSRRQNFMRAYRPGKCPYDGFMQLCPNYDLFAQFLRDEIQVNE
ncbi:hypothetical protein ACETRX_00505 [Labrys portucalensis]|uniref:Uncharacterized protein n=1 Tax=Labrys neptuniae TaxID=376174 RepID=A0ABV6Z7C5_9HYPH